MAGNWKSALRSTARRAVAEVTYRSGVSGLIGRRYGGPGVVFMFHEITRDADDRLGQGCQVQRFEALLKGLRRAGRDILSLSDARARLMRDGHAAKPFAVITFDDGYRDNVELALPLLERYGAPATIFVPTGMATREINAWWLALRELVTLNSSFDAEPMGRRFETPCRADKQATFQSMVDWIWQDFTRADAFSATFRRYGIDMADLVHRHALDLDEVRDADRHSLISIGAHTVTHRALSTLDDACVLREMSDNKGWLEQVLQRPVPHFAYPYGRPAISGIREAHLARRTGFEIAVTTDSGTLFAEHGGHETSLLWPRENGEFSTSDGAGLSWALNGTWRAARSRFGGAIANGEPVHVSPTDGQLPQAAE